MTIINRNQEVDQIEKEKRKLDKLSKEQLKKEKGSRMVKIDNKTIILTKKKGRKNSIKRNFIENLEFFKSKNKFN